MYAPTEYETEIIEAYSYSECPLPPDRLNIWHNYRVLKNLRRKELLSDQVEAPKITSRGGSITYLPPTSSCSAGMCEIM